VQTFLPFPDFERSIRALDFVRCRNQVRETKTLLSILVAGKTGGWASHPACLMWRGHESALAQYGIVNCRVNRLRGWQYNSLPFFEGVLADIGTLTRPPWLGHEGFHRSHRANLCRKQPGWYNPRLGRHEPEPYVWPVWNKVHAGGELLHSSGEWCKVLKVTSPGVALVEGHGHQCSGPDEGRWLMYRSHV
jgi:hypothetical protein